MPVSPALRRTIRRDRLRSTGLVLLTMTVLAVVAWTLARESTLPPESMSGRVARVVDGDTLLMQDGRRVRLLGIDTPETKHPTKPPQPWGEEASAFTRELAEGQPVRLEFDRERTDKYGRTLAWVWIEDTGTQRLLNRELVAAGLSPAVLISPLRPDYRAALIAAEREAKADARGLWSEPKEAASRGRGSPDASRSR